MTSNLKNIMDRQGLSVTEVARGSGLSLNTVRGIYKSTTKAPTIITMYSIAVFLGLKVSDIFESEGNE